MYKMSESFGMVYSYKDISSELITFNGISIILTCCYEANVWSCYT